jgi:hypothetical protein
MKIFKYISLLFFVFTFINCSNEELSLPQIDDEQTDDEQKGEPEQIIYFTLNVSDQYIFGENEEWIIIHDENGNLLDYEMLNGGSTLFFESLNTEFNSITITKFLHQQLSNGETSRFFITTYPGIAKGSTWNYGTPNSPVNTDVNPRISGSFSIQVDNIVPRYDFTISTFESIPSATYFETPFSSRLNMADVELFETNDYIISIFDGNNNLKYSFLENVQDGENRNLDYNQFLDFDTYVVIDLPNQSVDYDYFIDGLAESADYPRNSGYEYQSNLSQFGTPPYRPQLKLGYLNRFDKFKTFFGINIEDDYRYSYYKQGDPPEAIVIPEKPVFERTGESIFDSSFTTSTEYSYLSSVWQVVEETSETPPELGGPIPDSTTWAVYADSDMNTKVGTLPEELTSKFTNLNLEGIKYQSTALFVSPEPYSEFIARDFVTNISRSNTNYEREIITIGDN